MRPPIQNALTLPPTPPPQHAPRPLRQRKAPMARNQHATKNINHLNHESQEAVSALLNCQQHGLDIVLEEDARDGALADDVRLLGHGVLVCEDGAGRVGRARGVDGVDGGDDGEEILESVEVIGGRGDGAVEGVEEGGVEGSEGELGDDVGEVESLYSC